MVHGPPDQGELENRSFALQVAKSRTGDLGSPHRVDDVESLAKDGVGGTLSRWFAQPLDLNAVLLGEPLGGVAGHEVRYVQKRKPELSGKLFSPRCCLLYLRRQFRYLADRLLLFVRRKRSDPPAGIFLLRTELLGSAERRPSRRLEFDQGIEV